MEPVSTFLRRDGSAINPLAQDQRCGKKPGSDQGLCYYPLGKGI